MKLCNIKLLCVRQQVYVLKRCWFLTGSSVLQIYPSCNRPVATCYFFHFSIGFSEDVLCLADWCNTCLQRPGCTAHKLNVICALTRRWHSAATTALLYTSASESRETKFFVHLLSYKAFLQTCILFRCVCSIHSGTEIRTVGVWKVSCHEPHQLVAC